MRLRSSDLVKNCKTATLTVSDDTFKFRDYKKPILEMVEKGWFVLKLGPTVLNSDHATIRFFGNYEMWWGGWDIDWVNLVPSDSIFKNLINTDEEDACFRFIAVEKLNNIW